LVILKRGPSLNPPTTKYEVLITITISKPKKNRELRISQTPNS
jgi:hypothetical protein